MEGDRILRSWHIFLFKWLISHYMALVFLVREVATASRMASTSVGSPHTPLPVPSSLKIEKMIYTLGPLRLCLVWV